MLFPQTVEYALRAMACLSQPRDGEPLRAADLAQRTAIPIHYLSKVMRRLVTAGLLHSQRGHRGGFVLTRPPAEIRFEEILAAVGYGGDDHACVFGYAACDPKSPCPLHDAWAELKRVYAQWAHTTSLAAVRPATTSRTRLPVLAESPVARPTRQASETGREETPERSRGAAASARRRQRRA